MMEDFIYERETAPCGVEVETIYGADNKSAKVWKMFAMQIFSESGSDYRQIDHTESGAPLLDGIARRISVTHTSHFLQVASLPKTPETDLSDVCPRTAMGIDAETADRSQVLKIQDKFLNSGEKGLLPAADDPEKATAEDVAAYILAWTCKEALYKADLGKAADWKEDYRIIALPAIAEDMRHATQEKYGKGLVKDPLLGDIEMILTSWKSRGHIVTIAFSPKIAKFSGK
ncbi:MAG: 4'-phosphopantetheinyl transferase superfamily protein [Muribaculaceae bacterium]|nr:4'-phosphopantetheinyl transferase superfamily protein [Muribaculaceae bacterium]